MPTTLKQPPVKASAVQTGRHYAPEVDIYETTEGFVLQADLPGADPKSLDVSFEKGLLTLHAKVPARQDNDAKYLLREYGVGDFRRSFRVDETIDPEKIAAEYHNGVLTIRLPLAPGLQPRKVKVKVD